MSQDARAIDWDSDSTDDVVRKIRAAEGHPGVLDAIEGTEFHLFGVHREQALRGRAGRDRRPAHRRDLPGDGRRCGLDHPPQASRHADGAFFKLPATRALALAGLRVRAPGDPGAVDAPLSAGHTFREIAYEEHGGVGYLHFDFYNGAMSTEQCRAAARGLPLRALADGRRRSSR